VITGCALKFLFRLAINAVALWIAAETVPGIEFDGGIADLAVVALIFGLVNALVRPVVRLLTLPINVMTLGLFTLVVNGLMLLIAAAATESLNVDGGFVSQVGSAVLASLVISVVSTILSLVLPDGR
jgi:putative membrane protein